MRTFLLPLLIAVAMTAADAKTSKSSAAPKEPPAAAIEHAGDICKNTGGFGRVFGRGYGHVDAVASEDWAPFEKLAIEPGRIAAEASFAGATETLEDDVAKAEKFLKALDKAVKAKDKFKHREANAGAVRFSDGKEPGSGLVLELHQEREVVVAVCAGD